MNDTVPDPELASALAPLENKLKGQAVRYFHQERNGWGMGVRSPEAALKEWRGRTDRLQRLILLEIDERVRAADSAEERRFLLKRLRKRYEKLHVLNRWPSANLAPFRRIKSSIETLLEAEVPSGGPSSPKSAETAVGEWGLEKRERLFSTLSATLDAFEELNEEAQSFKNDIYPRVKEAIGADLSWGGVRDRLVNDILPVLRDRYPGLDLPTGVDTSEWKEKKEDLWTAERKWSPLRSAEPHVDTDRRD